MRHLPESRREAYRQLAVSRESVWSVADLQVLGIDIPQGVRHKWLIAASARACLRDPLTQAKLICFKLTPLGRELGRRLIQAQQRQLQRQLKKEA